MKSFKISRLQKRSHSSVTGLRDSGMVLAGPWLERERWRPRRVTMDDLISTVRARRLMKEIRQLRAAAGLSTARAAAQAGVSEATLWRMENGKTKIGVETLIALLDLYDVRPPRRDALERLAVDALRRGWWAPYRDVFSGSYVALETDASQIRVNAFAVPGFFQTPGYARAIIAPTRPELQLAEEERRAQAR